MLKPKAVHGSLASAPKTSTRRVAAHRLVNPDRRTFGDDEEEQKDHERHQAHVEAPNDEVVARIALSAASQGNVRSETVRAFTEDEYRKIIASLP